MKILIVLLFYPPLFARTLSVGLIGVTYHNTEVNSSASEAMPRKLTKDGLFVFHPEVNITSVNDRGHLINTTFLYDCFDKLALNFSLGKEWKHDNHNLNLSGGIYVFEKNEFNKIDVISVPADSIRYYMPVVWLGYGYTLPVTSDYGLSFQVNTNYFLVYGSVGILFNL